MSNWADAALEEKAHPTQEVIVAFWHGQRGKEKASQRRYSDNFIK